MAGLTQGVKAGVGSKKAGGFAPSPPIVRSTPSRDGGGAPKPCT